MMADQLHRYREYERFIQRLLVLAGVWPRTSEYCAFYGQLPGLATVSGIATIYGIAGFCQRHVTNLHLLLKGMGLIVSILTVILKAIVLRIYRDDLCKVSDILEFLFTDALNDPRLRPVLLSSLHLFDQPAYVISFITCSTTLMFVLSPLILIGYQFAKGVESVHYLLPYPVDFPWQVEGPGFFYQAVYLVETNVSWFIMFVTCGTDTLFGYYVFQMSAVLRVLSYEFETLRFNGDHANRLKSCVRKHNLLLRCRDIVQDIYGPIVLYLTVTNAIVLCSLIFQVAQTDGMTVGRAIHFFSYVTVKLTQAFLYSWYGTMLTAESEVFQREVYCSGWYESEDKSFAKGVVLLLMQKPIVLTASRFFHISIDLFVGISNTTISYFFLLQTLEDED